MENIVPLSILHKSFEYTMFAHWLLFFCEGYDTNAVISLSDWTPNGKFLAHKPPLYEPTNDAYKPYSILIDHFAINKNC